MAISLRRKILNIDTNVKCTLQCPSCKRTDFKEKFGQNVALPGRNLTVEDLKKCLKYFNGIIFCGQHSDPIFSPYLIDMLSLCYDAKVYTEVITAATGRPQKWYQEAFLANPDCQWTFGIDGPPNLSHIYRKNQKGEHLFNIMCLAKELGLKRVVWQYIVFEYNEDYIEECEQLAKEKGIIFILIIPSRTLPDYLMPKKEKYTWKNYVNT